MQTTAEVIIETVYFEGPTGWMVEVRFDGRPFSSYGPYTEKSDAQVWAMEIGKRVAQQAEDIKMRLIAGLEAASF